MSPARSGFRGPWLALILLFLWTGRASENSGVIVTVEPRKIREALIGGLFGTRSVAVTVKNAGGEATVLDGQAGVEFELMTTNGPVSLGSQVLPADPLQLPPGAELTIRWDPATRPDLRLAVPLRASVRLVGLTSPVVTGEALYVPAPHWITVLREQWIPWLLGLLGARIALGIHRIRRRAVSRWRRIPLTVWDRLWLLIWLRMIGSVSRLPLPEALRRWLLLPVLSSLRCFTIYWQTSWLGMPQCVAIGDRLVNDLPPDPSFPANPVFMFHWYAALAFDATVRASDNNVNLATAASVLAERYRAAALHAGEDELRGLANAAEGFYSAVAAHFSGARMHGPNGQDSEVGRGPTRLLQVAAARLRQGSASAPEAEIAGLAVLAWVDAGAKGWPPPLVLRSDVDRQAINFPSYVKLDQMLEEGDLFRGRRAIGHVKSERDPSIGRNTATALASRIHRLSSLNLRFNASYPVGETRLRLAKEQAREAINNLKTDARWCESPGLACWAAATSAELYLSLGDRKACLGELGRVSSDQGADRWAIEARALAEGVRSELYGGCGALKAAIRASRDAALWSALTGDFVGWRRLRAVAAKQALDEFEQGRCVLEDAKVALSELTSIERSARCFGRKGWPDLFAGLRLWARYLIAIESEDRNEGIALSGFHRWPSAGITRFDLMLGFVATRILPTRLVAELFPQNLITAMGRRFSHAVNVLLVCDLRFMEHELAEYPRKAGKLIRLAEAHLKKGNLDLPQPLVMQYRAQVNLEWLMLEEGPPGIESAIRACEDAILAVHHLVKERETAPTDALQRSAGVQRNTVIETLIHVLTVVQPVLDEQTFQRFSTEAYLALQSLRIETWETLRQEKEVATTSQQEAPIAHLHGLGARLTSFLDRLTLAGGWITAGLRPEWSALLGEVPELGLGDPVGQLRAAQQRARERLGELLRERAERSCAGPARTPRPVAAMPAKFPPGHAWIEYYISPRRACAFVITGLRLKPEFIPLPCIQMPDLGGTARRGVNGVRAIRRACRDLGKLMPVEAAEVTEATREFERALSDLSAKLWPRRLHELVGDCGHIHIVPWGDLWRVPFPALTNPEGTPLVSERVITISPFGPLVSNDIAPWKPLAGNQIALLAHDVGKATRHRLEKLDEEVSRLHHRFPSAIVLKNENATPDGALAALRHSRWFHVACHGQADPDLPMFSRLALARSAFSPDGSLYLYQLDGTSSTLEGVFLSACESNLGSALGDRPETLAFGFLSMGARTVVATLGPIFDEVALLVTDFFYEELQREPPEAALCLAVRRFMASGAQGPISSLAIPRSHPFLWWPLVLISRR